MHCLSVLCEQPELEHFMRRCYRARGWESIGKNGALYCDSEERSFGGQKAPASG